MGTPFVLGALTVMLALVVVALKTLRNGAATESVAKMLYDTEHPAAPSRPASGRHS